MIDLADSIKLFGISVIALVGFLQLLRPDRSDRRLRAGVIVGAALAVGVIEAVDAIRDRRKRAEMAHALDLANARLAEVDAEVRGTGAVPYFTFFPTEIREVWSGYLHNGGAGTLHDVYFRIVDLTKLAEIEASSLSPSALGKRMSEADIEGRLARVGPHRVAMNVLTLRMPDRDRLPRHGLNIFFTTRNGEFVQQLRFLELSGRWHQSFRVDGSLDQPLIEIDPRWPKDECERPLWDWPGGPDGGPQAIAHWWGPCPR